MRENDRNKRNYIIIGLCTVVMIMAVGFAAFSQQLQINSTSEVTSSWCLGFDNTKTNTYVAAPGIQTGTAPTGSITYGGSSCGSKSQTGVTIASNLNQPGDSIEYTLTILNEGSLNAAVKSILVDNTEITSNQTITKGNVKYQINMPSSTSISASSSTTMKVTVSFQNETDITKSFSGENSSIEVKINAEEDAGNGGSSPAMFTGTIYRYNDISANIGDSIVPVSGTKWCIFNAKTGEDYNYCLDTQEECQADIDDAVLNGYTQQGDEICQQKTIPVGGIGEYTTSQSEIQNQHDYYLKHDVVDDIITASYVCFVTDTERCIQGGDSSYYNTNKTIIEGFQTHNSVQNLTCKYDYNYCTSPESCERRSFCRKRIYEGIMANINGLVSANIPNGANDNKTCIIEENGISRCSNSVIIIELEQS